jgi:hypothetical protein
MKPIRLSKEIKTAPALPASVPPPKPVLVFEDEPDSRYGFYYATKEVRLVKYRIPFVVKEGQKVEVVEDKGDRVLVHLNEISTIYIDSEDFFRDFERAKR